MKNLNANNTGMATIKNLEALTVGDIQSLTKDSMNGRTMDEYKMVVEMLKNKLKGLEYSDSLEALRMAYTNNLGVTLTINQEQFEALHYTDKAFLILHADVIKFIGADIEDIDDDTATNVAINFMSYTEELSVVEVYMTELNKEYAPELIDMAERLELDFYLEVTSDNEVNEADLNHLLKKAVEVVYLPYDMITNEDMIDSIDVELDKELTAGGDLEEAVVIDMLRNDGDYPGVTSLSIYHNIK